MRLKHKWKHGFTVFNQIVLIFSTSSREDQREAKFTVNHEKPFHVKPASPKMIFTIIKSEMLHFYKIKKVIS